MKRRKSEINIKKYLVKYWFDMMQEAEAGIEAKKSLVEFLFQYSDEVNHFMSVHFRGELYFDTMVQLNYVYEILTKQFKVSNLMMHLYQLLAESIEEK